MNRSTGHRYTATITATVEDKDGYTVITPATHADAENVAEVVEYMYNRYWIGGEIGGLLTYTVPTLEDGRWGVHVVWL